MAKYVICLTREEGGHRPHAGRKFRGAHHVSFAIHIDHKSAVLREQEAAYDGPFPPEMRKAGGEDSPKDTTSTA